MLADELTRSPVHTTSMDEQGRGYALRFPRLVAFRDADKRPEDATTVAEIASFYRQQRLDPQSKGSLQPGSKVNGAGLPVDDSRLYLYLRISTDL